MIKQISQFIYGEKVIPAQKIEQAGEIKLLQKDILNKLKQSKLKQEKIPNQFQSKAEDINGSIKHLQQKQFIELKDSPHKQKKSDQTQSILEDRINSPQDNKVNTNQNIQPKTNKSHLKYRADIDGLRTIAVGIVVIFHAWPNFIPGGFIGVDVFFIISGYLITGIIIKDKDFSFLNFYQRRIKRIFPALIIVLLFIIYFICINFPPINIKRTAQTICASTYFSANLQLLYYKSGYFDVSMKLNPVLHLWSLGIQEQFYFIWPILILLMKKVTTEKLWIGFILFTIFSFIFNMVYAQSNKEFDFYFPICRFWEMSIGGILSAINLQLSNKIIYNIFSVLGLSGILICAWLYSESFIYPGAWALIPTISAVFLIIGTQNAFINKHILSSQYFVLVGKISYPLYLWHWPLLVFLDVIEFRKDNYQIFLVVCASILLSLLTYYLVENNLRFNKSKIVIITLIALMIFIGIFTKKIADDPQKFSQIYKQATAQYNQNNIDAKMQPTPQDYAQINGRWIPHIGVNKNRNKPSISQLNFLTNNMWLFNNQPFNELSPSSVYYEKNDVQMHAFQSINEGKNKSLFIIGDSHAQFNSWRFNYLYGQSVLNNKTQQFPTIVLMAKRGVPVFSCDSFYNFFMNYIHKHKPTRILFSYRWLLYWKNYKQDNSTNLRNYPCFYFFGTPKWDQLMRKTTSNIDLQREINQIGNTLKQIVDLGTQVYVATVNPQGPQFAPYNMKIKDIPIDDGHSISLAGFKNQYKYIIEPLQQKILSVGAKIVDFSDYQCLNGVCYRLLPNGFTTNLDQDHPHRYMSKYWTASLDFLTQF